MCIYIYVYTRGDCVEFLWFQKQLKLYRSLAVNWVETLLYPLQDPLSATLLAPTLWPTLCPPTRVICRTIINTKFWDPVFTLYTVVLYQIESKLYYTLFKTHSLTRAIWLAPNHKYNILTSYIHLLQIVCATL